MDISDIENGYKERQGFPLTPEILVKAGFIYLAGQWNWNSIALHIEKKYFIYLHSHRIIKYLHELQNLTFALTGKELEINL